MTNWYQLVSDVASDVISLLQLSVGGRSWTVYRGTGTPTSQGVKTLDVFRNQQLNQQGQALAGTTIYDAEWLVKAELGTDILVNDIIVSIADTSYVFNVNGKVTTDLGVILAPLVPTRKPV
jgi:hypothetical protein